DARRFLQGVLACAAAVVAFVIINGLIEAQYPVPPPEFTASLPAPLPAGSDVSREFSLSADIVLWGLFGVLAFVCWRIAKTQGAKHGLRAGILLIAGVLLQLGLFYHLAALWYLAGGALSLRHGSPATPHWLGALSVC